MAKKPRIQLLNGWSNYSRDNPDGPPTFLRGRSEAPGPLQVSMAEYKSGAVPNPTEQDLIQLAKETGQHQDFGELVESNSGSCTIGKYGTAVFRSDEYPRIQVWYLSNGQDFIIATHICPQEPDPEEVTEAQWIIQNVVLTEKPWWKFW